MVKKKAFNTLLISLFLVLGVFFVYAATSFSISSPVTTEFYTNGNLSITCATSDLPTNYTLKNITLFVLNSSITWNGINNSQYYTANTSATSDNSYTFTLNTNASSNTRFNQNYTYNCLFGFNLTNGDGPNIYFLNWSSNKSFIVDNLAPNITLINVSSSEGIFGGALDHIFVNNISLGFGFVFNDSSPTANCSLIVDGASINDSIVATNNTNYWFNVTAKNNFDVGFHTWNITCYDKANNKNGNATLMDTGVNYVGSNFTLTDTIGPTSTLTLSSTAIAKSATETITCSGTDLISSTLTYQIKVTDPTGSISTTSGSPLSYTSTSTIGSYTVACRSLDTTGNPGAWTTDQTFTTSSSNTATTSGGTSSSSSSSSTPTTTEITEVASGETKNLGTLTQTIANNVIMGAESVATFTMATSSNIETTESHSVTISEITDTSVTIIIQSDPITLELNIGDIKTVDVDGDGTSDLELTLNGITDGNADITINTLVQIPEVEPTASTSEPTSEPKAKSSTGWWIALIIVVIGLIAWFLFRKKK